MVSKCFPACPAVSRAWARSPRAPGTGNSKAKFKKGLLWLLHAGGGRTLLLTGGLMSYCRARNFPEQSLCSNEPVKAGPMIHGGLVPISESISPVCRNKSPAWHRRVRAAHLNSLTPRKMTAALSLFVKRVSGVKTDSKTCLGYGSVELLGFVSCLRRKGKSQQSAFECLAGSEPGIVS